MDVLQRWVAGIFRPPIEQKDEAILGRLDALIREAQFSFGIPLADLRLRLSRAVLDGFPDDDLAERIAIGIRKDD
jgi:hypothetical protein